jgi:DNA-binding protein YbaB
MIHNANLASNLRWLYEEGSIPEDEWEQYSSAAGALLKYRQGFAPPTPVQPAAINNAFYTITQEGKGDVEYISGIHSSMMGISNAQPETYRGLLANDEYGTRRIKAWMGSVVEPALEHLGRVFKEVAQATYTVHKVFRIVQPEAGKDDNERKSEMNIPVYNDYGEAIGKWLDYGASRFDIKLVGGATMPVNRWALLEEYFRWFQAGLIDDIAMLGETDVRNKKGILERKSLYAQLQKQVAQMEEQLKDSEGTVETLSRQLVQAGIKGKIGEQDVEIRKDSLDTKAQQKLYRNIMKKDFDEYQKGKEENSSKK